MLKVILAVFAASMSLAMLACTGAAVESSRTSQECRANLFMGVEDLPCRQIVEDVRRALEKDPRLGLAKDEKTPDGWIFFMPSKAVFLGSVLRWSARVRIPMPWADQFQDIGPGQFRKAGTHR